MVVVRHWLAVVSLAAGLGITGLALQPADELAARLAAIGRRVEDYYGRARSLICRETVYLQPLRRDLMPEGPPRQLVYELRVAWESDRTDMAEATVTRRLLSVNGRPPSPNAEPECTDPRAESVDPLVTLLPDRHAEFIFAMAGASRMDGREVVRIDYRPVVPERPQVNWNGDCASIDLAGQTRGRVWVDAATHDVLRLDERIEGQFEFPVISNRAFMGRPRTMVVERADTTVRYKPVTFTEPDETLLLPASVDTLTVVRNAAVEWSRKTQVFSEYRRFMGSGRVLP